MHTEKFTNDCNFIIVEKSYLRFVGAVELPWFHNSSLYEMNLRGYGCVHSIPKLENKLIVQCYKSSQLWAHFYSAISNYTSLGDTKGIFIKSLPNETNIRKKKIEHNYLLVT